VKQHKHPHHPRVTDPAALAIRLSRGARAASAKVAFVNEVPFGPALTLRRYRLGNGLLVLVLADPSTPLLSYHTWFRVGSRHERKGKTGLAHLFEHLMFGPTRNHAPGVFDRRIESAGGETNASTWVDWTQYHTELPATELEVIVALEADRMHELVLREPQVRSEKEVVANERRFRVDDDVEGEVQERLYSLAFRRHPYHHPTIGWMKDIEGFTTADCHRFYKMYYAPNNATLIVVGDVHEAKLLELVQRHYGGLKAAKIEPAPSIIEGPQRSERKHVMRRATPTQKLAIGYHAPAFGDADYPVLSLINELLFVGRSARMFQRLVRKEQLAADVHGGIAPFVDPGLYDIWVGLRPGRRAAEALRVIDEELARMRDERVPKKDLERVKARAELSFLMALESAAGKAEQIGFYEAVLGDAGRIFPRLQDFRAVTADDVQRVARRVLDRSQRTRIEVIPAKGSAHKQPKKQSSRPSKGARA
jgi:zinc protease